MAEILVTVGRTERGVEDSHYSRLRRAWPIRIWPRAALARSPSGLLYRAGAPRLQLCLILNDIHLASKMRTCLLCSPARCSMVRSNVTSTIRSRTAKPSR